MYCPHCGTQNADESRFCANCGKQIGTAVAENTDFATRASDTILSGAPTAAPTAAPVAAPVAGGAAETGERLGSYVLQEELGRGAMARVWRAWDTNLEREVAIKEPLFDPTLPADVLDEMGRRFVKEGRAAARLNHPNIVTIHAADVYDGRPAIVMALIDGTTLGNLLERGPLSPGEALSVLDQLLDAIGYAHDNGVVHRDIKPDNIFIDSSGTVKLADFGIAHLDESTNTRATMVGTVLGTPGYMSPEQARGTSVDGRSDLFSVGTVAYEMLTGTNPFGAGDTTTLLYRIVHEPVDELPPSASTGLASDIRPAIMAALSKEPENRPQSAAAFKAMLHGSVEVPPPVNTGNPELARKATRTSSGLPKWLPWVAGAAVLAGVLIALLANASSGVGTGGSVPDGGTSSAVINQISENAETTAPVTYQLGVANGQVVIYASNQEEALRITNLAADQLSEDIAAQVDSGEEFATEEDALAKVEEFTQALAKPTGPPVFTAYSASSVLPKEENQDIEYDPERAFDGRLDSAWVEGNTAEGATGEGEWIEVRADEDQLVSRVTITAGYYKSAKAYTRNVKPREVELAFSDGSTQRATLEKIDYREGDTSRYCYQDIVLDEPKVTSSVRITIISTYPGEWFEEKKPYEDCCISEIEVA